MEAPWLLTASYGPYKPYAPYKAYGKRGARKGPQNRGGPHETPKPLKNSYFHEENSPILGALKNRFSREIFVGKLVASKRPARRQQEASKKPTRGQQEASKRPARGQQEASKKPARSQQEASKRPARCQQEARGQQEAPNGGDPTKHRNH